MSGSEVAKSDALQFCPVLAGIVRDRTLTGRSGRVFRDLPALSTTNNLVILRRLMMELNPQRTMEIGLAFGGSCLTFAATHRDLHHPPSGQHVALDPYQAEAWDDCGLIVLNQAGLADYVDFRSVRSSSELPRLVDQRSRFGLIYIDGSHLFENVFVDAYYSLRLLSDGGVVAFDDCGDANIQKVIRFLRANCGESLEELDLGRFRVDQGKSWRYRIGKLLGKTQMIAFKRNKAVERAWDAKFHAF